MDLFDVIGYIFIFGFISIVTGLFAFIIFLALPHDSFSGINRIYDSSILKVLNEKYPKKWFFIPKKDWINLNYERAQDIRNAVCSDTSINPFLLDCFNQENRGVYFIMLSEKDAIFWQKQVNNEIISFIDEKLIKNG